MAQRIVDKTGGHKLTGGPLTIPDELNFTTTSNPEIDSTGGDFIHKVKTNTTAAYKVQGDTSGTDVILVDSTTGSEKVTLNADLAFATTTSPEIDSTGGSFIWKIVTAAVTAWKLRDDTKGQDIITIDTDTDTITANSTDYSFVGFNSAPVLQKVFADSPVTAAWGDDFEIDCTGGNVIVNYPTSVGNNGKTISITKIDVSGNTITAEPSGAETINGVANTTINSQWETLLAKSNGTNLTTR